MPTPLPLQAHELPLCLVAVRTATGVVTFKVTRRPTEQVIHLGTQLVIDQRSVLATPHAERIARELREQFTDHAVGVVSREPWFLVDWEQVTRAIEDFDPATGWRTRLGDISVGAEVQVDLWNHEYPDSKRRGQVVGIAGRRYIVKLSQPYGRVGEVIAPRSMVKPVVRVAALAEF